MARMVRTPVISESDESYDETGTTEGTTSETENNYPVHSGWGAPVVRHTFAEREKAPKFEIELKDLEEHIIKIHDDQPYVSYFQHILNQGGWKFLTCSQARHPETKVVIKPLTCPMCVAGHNPREAMMLNVTDMSKRDEVMAYTFSYEVQEQLQKFMKGPKGSDGKPTVIPINSEERYWMIQRSNTPRTNYSVMPLKARDLEEDHGISPLNAKEFGELSKTHYGKGVVWINSEKELQAVADHYEP